MGKNPNPLWDPLNACQLLKDGVMEGLVVNTIVGKNYTDRIITTIELRVLNLNNIFCYILLENHCNKGPN